VLMCLLKATDRRGKQILGEPAPGSGAREVPRPMTTIKASCPTCGDVELTAHQVRLVVCSVRSWSYYAFSCASCLEEIRKPAGRDVVALLISGGVLAEPWAVPAEALEPHDGPPLQYDDVLDFALWLDRADLVAAAAAQPAVRPAGGEDLGVPEHRRS
jgi:hypothetical protein